MKNFLFSLFIVLTVCSCASTENKITNIYELYKTYIIDLKNDQYNPAIELLSFRNQNDLKENSKLKSFTDYFPVLASLDEVIVNEINYFKKNELSKSCLTINGYDSSKEPTTIHIEFVNEKGEWKLDYVQVMYLGSKKEFPKKAACPVMF
jgi:hypothetical protein